MSAALLAPDFLGIQSLIFYFARKKLYHHVSLVATQALQKRANDAALLFWRAYAALKEGHLSDAASDLDGLRARNGVQLPSLICLKQVHMAAKFTDREAIDQIEKDIVKEEKAKSEGSFFIAAQVLMLMGDHKKAREYIARVVEIQASYPQSKSMAGWIELTCGLDVKAKKAIDLFKEAQVANPADIDAFLGQATYMETVKKDFSGALDVLANCVVKFSWFTPTEAEKARLLVASREWDLASESANRALQLDPNSIEALSLSILILMAKESKYSAASSQLGELVELIKEVEPHNAELCHEQAALFARLCARHGAILNQCLQLITKATELDPNNSTYMTELGYQLTLSGDFGAAITSYSKACQLDEANMTACYGKITAQVLRGDASEVEEAAQQFEFLNEIHGGGGGASVEAMSLCYIGALIASRKDRDPTAAVRQLQETARVHQEAAAADVLSVASLTRLNPDFVINLAREMLEHAGSEPPPPGEAPSPLVAKALDVLRPVISACPGILDVKLMVAHTRYLSRDYEGAQSALADAIAMDPSHSSGHMLMAKILIELGRFREANASLEQALSLSFQVRESPIYFLLRAQCHEKQGEWKEALRELQAAMKLPGVATAAAPQQQPARGAAAGKKGNALKGPSPEERAQIFIHLATVHTELGQTHEATKVIQDAKVEFREFAAHAHIQILDSDLALRRGDVQSALNLLKGVKEESPHYIKARLAAANIHLTHRHDKKTYIRYFEELKDMSSDSVGSWCMLAEAYMRLQEPDKAVLAYQEARKLEEKQGGERGDSQSDLAGKIGQAFISSHDFQGAIQYLEEAVRKQPRKLGLRLTLADLLMKLARTKDAIAVCVAADEMLGGGDSAESLISRTRVLLLQAKVYTRAGQAEEYAKCLVDANALQSRVLARLRGEAGDLAREQRKVAADICAELAKHHEHGKRYNEALALYGEALRHEPKHAESLLSLAKLHMDRQELSEARKQCQALLKHDLEVEKATMMLADLMFRSNEFDEAIRYFAQMLEHKPNNYKALEQLILLVRRAGRLHETAAKGGDALRFLKLAERSSARVMMDGGFHYCKGIYARYLRNFPEALEELNQARKDGEWGSKAICHMIEIYLDTDQLGGELNTGAMIETDKVKMARVLRQELTSGGAVAAVKLRLYEAYEYLMIQHTKTVEQAVNKFTEILNDEKDSVAALLGLSHALRLLKQDAKARNHLKRISKMQYNSEEAEEMEQSYLLLAEGYIESNKNDLAQELCRKCLTHNKSCAKAWEYQGLIYEKEASYADAAQVYEMAWQFDNHRNAAVGYKLAFNLLKAKRYVDAINICHLVLQIQPGYTKLEQEILFKARQSLRP